MMRPDKSTIPVVGVLLAGGQSSRMGGGDKCLRLLANRTMLAHVIDRLAPQVDRLIINANGDPQRFSSFGLPVVSDTVGGFVGPLAGILAGMRWVRDNVPEADHMASVSTDAPFLPHDLVARLGGALADRPGAVAVARSLGELHPVIGLWPVARADDLEAALADGVRKVLRWTDRHGTVPVDFDAPNIGGVTLDPFFNANTPEDLMHAAELLAQGSA